MAAITLSVARTLPYHRTVSSQKTIPGLDTSPAVIAAQAEAIRALTHTQRLQLALSMSDEARALTEAGIRQRHPRYSDEEVLAALLTAMLGAEVASRVRTRR